METRMLVSKVKRLILMQCMNDTLSRADVPFCTIHLQQHQEVEMQPLPCLCTAQRLTKYAPCLSS
eukprot:807713-Amphidinium_carterae.1